MKSVVTPMGSLLAESPPSRGAWIEIQVSFGGPIAIMSPPSRGAWIEIISYPVKSRKK